LEFSQMLHRRPYPTDVTDAQWAILEPLLPPESLRGRPREVSLREIVNALLYVLRTGCAWDYLPHDLPPSDTVYGYFRKWQADGTLEHLHDTLRRRVRAQAGKNPEPTAAIIDSQSVKTTEKGGSPARSGTMRGRKSKDANGISW
jgi:putative transposase